MSPVFEAPVPTLNETVPETSLPERATESVLRRLPPLLQPGWLPAVTRCPPIVRVLIEVRLRALKLLVVNEPPTVKLPTTLREAAVRILATATAPCRLVM